MDLKRGEIGVGLVEYRFMGCARSNACRQVGRFFDPERVNEHQVYFENEPSEAKGLRTVMVTVPARTEARAP